LCLAHNLNLMKKNSLTLHFLYIVIGVMAFTSCAPVKNVVYFQNLPKDTELNNVVTNNFELKIRKNDLLGITVVSPDPISTPLFNGAQATTVSQTSSAGGNQTGYLVDNTGKIYMYKLGAIQAEGLTRNELRLKLQRDLSPYLKDAVVTVQFLSNRVTVLGEVAQPQVLSIPNEQISLLEALARSGDLTITGRRDNVLVIRETATGKQFKRINLNDNSIFSSPFYYLKPDDIVYVEPTKYKINNTAQTAQIISYVLSGITILITIFSLLNN
jgi:polysaccharide biosynthesis/export protein